MRLALLLWMTGCSGTVCWFDQCVDEPTKTVDALECPPEMSWEIVAKPFLNTWCTSCHASALNPNDRMGAPQGVDFDTWEGAAQWSDRIAAVSHGEGATMPPAGGPTDAEREAIVAWVACGALGPVTAFGLCEQPRVVEGDVRVTSDVDTEALCDGGDGLQIAGDLFVAATTDIMPACVCAVDGDLTVEGLTASTMRWAALRQVGGDLTLADNHGTRDMSFPELVGVQGTLFVERNDVSQRVDLPNLATIGGDLRVTERGTGGGFTAPRLASVDGEVAVQDNPQLLQLELLRLASTGGSIQITDNPRLADIGSLDTLTRVGGDLVISGSGLRSFTGLRYITELRGDLTLSDHESLTAIDLLHVLEAIDGAVTLEQMPALTTIQGFYQLLQVEGDLTLTSVHLSDLLAFETIRQIGGAMTVERMPALQTLEMSTQSIDGGLRIHDNGALEGVAGWSYLERLGNLRISENPLLREVRGLAGLTTVSGELAVVDNPRLLDLDGLVGLSDIAGSLTLHNDDALADIEGLHNLTRIGGDLVITDNAALSIKSVEALLEAIGADSVEGTIVLRGEDETSPSDEESDTGLSSG